MLLVFIYNFHVTLLSSLFFPESCWPRTQDRLTRQVGSEAEPLQAFFAEAKPGKGPMTSGVGVAASQ